MLTLSRISHNHSGPVIDSYARYGNRFISYFTCFLLEDTEFASFAYFIGQRSAGQNVPTEVFKLAHEPLTKNCKFPKTIENYHILPTVVFIC